MTPRQREIRDTYRRIGSSRAAADELGVTRQRVEAVLDEIGEPRSPSPIESLVAANLRGIRRSRAQKRSVASIAAEIGLHVETLRKHLRRHDIDTSQLRKYDDAERAEWERLYLEEGKSSYAIARLLKVPRGTISSHIADRGIGRDRIEASRAALGLPPRKKSRGRVRARV